ncbi:MAG: DUF6364 family protein [Saprospiraceae bacterium]|nr:DUF6364 family protein [Saprospiraceae bacterium]
MNSKLTLSIEEEVIQAAKDYARRHGKSLSNLVEEYLKSVTTEKSTGEHRALSKIIKDLKGSVALPKDSKAYKELLQDALVEKYLK